MEQPNGIAQWNTVERVRVVAAQPYRLLFSAPCTLISILSPRGFQLPTIRVGWCFSAVVSTANFACQLVLVCCSLQSLSSECSTASLSLIRCNLVSLSSEVSFPFFRVLSCCKVACMSFTSSLSSMFGMVPHPQFLNLWSAVSVGLCLFLRHHWSSCSCAD